MAKKSKTEFVLNREGVRELLQSDAMLSVLNSYAQNAMAQLGDGYEVSSHVGKNRASVRIEAVTSAAKKDNSENNTLLKAVGV